MSASEKLRELYAAAAGPQTYGPEPLEEREAARVVLAALPLIADVVETAEEVSRLEATGTLPDFQPLADALTALNEHLTRREV